MSPAHVSSVGIVAYLALFVGVGVLFLFANLLVGRFLRPDAPNEEKQEIYECGEPTIGSSFVQFDLRFYVVALLFIIFDVEAAFFFPWAVVFGKSDQLADAQMKTVQVQESGELGLTPQGEMLYRELGVASPTAPQTIPASLRSQIDADADPAVRGEQVVRKGAKQLMWVTIVDIAVFFAVLLVGFAYVWKRGDLDWVRTVSQERAGPRIAS